MILYDLICDLIRSYLNHKLCFCFRLKPYVGQMIMSQALLKSASKANSMPEIEI